MFLKLAISVFWGLCLVQGDVPTYVYRLLFWMLPIEDKGFLNRPSVALCNLSRKIVHLRPLFPESVPLNLVDSSAALPANSSSRPDLTISLFLFLNFQMDFPFRRLQLIFIQVRAFFLERPVFKCSLCRPSERVRSRITAHTVQTASGKLSV